MKKILLLILCLILATLAFAQKYSGDFPMGTYSYIANVFAWHKEYRDELCRQMQALGYNTAMVQTDTKDTDLVGLYEDLDKYGLDAVLLDRSWSTDRSSMLSYGMQALTTSNYDKFEAEYSGERSVRDGDTNDSAIWYSSVSDKYIKRIGSAKADPAASNGYVWSVTQSERPGYAYGDLSLRWPKKDRTYFRVGQVWQVFQADPAANDKQFFYIRYRFKLENIKSGLADGDTLLTFSPSGFPLQGGGYSGKSVNISHQKDDDKQALDKTSYTLKDFRNAKSDNGFITVTIKMSYADMIKSGMMAVASSKMLKVINLNPRLYWHGNCDLALDYIEYEDQMHYDLRTQPGVFGVGVQNRARYLKDTSKGNLLALYSFDEPLQSQLDSFGLVQNYLKDTGIDMFTATHDYNYRVLTIDGKKDTYYSHLGNFFATAKPKIVAPDIYPLNPDLDWNGSSQGVFIQTQLNQKLHTAYRDAKTYSDQAQDRKFYPIVQVFGKWGKVKDDPQWTSWILAPYATQKALIYFPLCYGPDGIFHYRLQSFRTLDGQGDYCPIYTENKDGKYDVPKNDAIPYRAVIDTKARTKFYGSMLKSMQWLDALTLMTDKTSMAKTYPKTGLNYARVEKSPGKYQGYVQCGLYSIDGDNPVLMLVNRRGNYFKPGTISVAKEVPYSEYEAYFPEADPQTMTIVFDKKLGRVANKELAWYDPFDHSVYYHKNGKLSLSLPAGEGKLLIMVQLPEKMISNAVVYDKPVLISQNTDLNKNSSLSCNSTQGMTIMPKVKLNLAEGSVMTIKGKLRLLTGSSIIVAGTLKVAPENVILDEGASIMTMDGYPYPGIITGTRTKQLSR